MNIYEIPDFAYLELSHGCIEINEEVIIPEKQVTVEFIQKTICDYFYITPDEMKANTRKRETVQARQTCMLFTDSLTKLSLAKIGQLTGNKDHATVLHAKKTINNLIDTDKSFKNQIKEIDLKLKIN